VVLSALESLLANCEEQGKLTKDDVKRLDQGIKEIELKKDNFENVLGILRDLENEHT